MQIQAMHAAMVKFTCNVNMFVCNLVAFPYNDNTSMHCVEVAVDPSPLYLLCLVVGTC